MPKLQFQRVPFPLVGGVETKVSDMVLQPPKLITAENCFIERTGSIRRRKGITALTNSTVDAGTAGAGSGSYGSIAKYKNTLLSFDHPSLAAGVYQYSESAAAWSEHGSYAPGVMTNEDIAAAGGGSSTNGSGIWQTDVATANTYTLYATIEDGIDDSGLFNSTVRVSLQDALGTFICHRLQVFSDGSGASVAEKMGLRVVSRLNLFYVFFGDFTNHDIRCWIIDTSSPATITSAIGTSGGGSAAASVLVASDLHTATPLYTSVFDVAADVTHGIFLCYRTTTANQLKMGFVSTSGVLGSTSTIVTAGDAQLVSVATMILTTPHRFGIAYSLATTPNDIYAVHRTWNGSVWATLATSGALETLATDSTLAIACRYDDDANHDKLRVWYSTLNVTFQATYTTAGAASSRVVRLRKTILAARPFLAGSTVYFWCLRGYGTQQPTFYLVESATGLPVGESCRNVAALAPLSSVADNSSGGMIASLMYVTNTVDGDIDFASGAVNMGVRAPTYWQDHDQAFKFSETADSLVLAGSLVQTFDGVTFTELGFLEAVDMDQVTLTPAPHALGLTASALYWYIVIPAQRNARGKIERGTHFGPKSVTLGAGDGQVTLTIPAMHITRRRRTNTVVSSAQTARSDLVLEVYRSAANPASSKTSFTKVGEVLNDVASDTLTFVDQKPDATALLNANIYTQNGELDHTSAPPGHIMCEGAGRVFIAGAAEFPNTVFYSLKRTPDEPVAFNDGLTIILPEAGGDITALAVCQEALVVFKERAIYRVRGSGLDNTGQNGGYFDPELITNDIGCEGQRSVVVAPFGVMFQSARGFQLLDNGLTEVSYVGAALEGMVGNDQPAGTLVDGAVLLPMEQQVRFSGGGGLWVFDYWHKEWFRFLGGMSGPSVEFEGRHYALGASNVVYEDDSVEFNATRMRLVLACLRGGSQQDDLHVRYFAVSGRLESGSMDLRVKAYADHEGTIADQTETETSIPVGPFFFQWRTDDTTRIVSNLRLEIDDNGQTGKVTLTEVEFELAPRGRALSARVTT